MKLKTLSLVALLGLVAVLPALGQGVQTGTLQGTVKDDTGDVLPGVLVSINSPALQGEREVMTGVNGTYIFRGLPPGTYTVLFELEGMATVERSSTVDIGRPARVDTEMSVASVTETIVVTGESANALETTTIGANYDDDMIDALAITRDLDGIAALAPGVTTNTPLAGQVTISGGYAYDNLFMVDGVDVNDNVFGNPDNLFIEEAIQETQILASGVSAEYGRFSGGVINAVTKSGGNQFSGSGRVDFTNPSWRDENPLEEENGTERPDNQNEIFTATLGGYLMKDHLWFFLAGRDTEFNNQITLQGTGIPFNNVQNDQRWEVKLTGNINQSHTLSGTYTDSGSDQVQPASVAAGSTLDTIINPKFPNTLFVGRYNGILSDRLFLEAQYSEKEFAFEEFGNTSTDIFDSPFRCWNTFGANCQYHAPLFDGTDPEDRNNEQIAGALSWFADTPKAGTHDVKFGVEVFDNVRTGGNNNSSTDWVLFHDPVIGDDGLIALDETGRATPVFTSLFDSPAFGLGVFFEAARGSVVNIETTALFVNDSWQLGDHWSFNLGVRYEDADSDSTQGIKPIDPGGDFVPRLAAAYDVKGDGKYRFEASYAEYLGAYNMALFTGNTNTGNASYVYGPYIGPSGQGRDFAPGFDPDNYLLIAGNIPTLNIFHDPDLSAPRNEEYAFSFGYALPRAGYLKATYQNRSLKDVVENFTNFQLGSSTGEIQGVEVTLDNQLLANTDESIRDYEAILLQGRYSPLRNLVLQGHWTHQLTNDGNQEGEGGQSIGPGLTGVGDFPEFLDPERNYPIGRLSKFQENVLRLWAIYKLDFGRAGDLSLSTTYTYNSPLTYSLNARFPLTAAQLANDPGYVAPPPQQNLWFAERGSEEFSSWDRWDLAAIYSIGIWRNLEVSVKGEVRNVLNDKNQIGWDTTVFGDTDGPLDSLGRPLTFTEGSSFGTARNNNDYQFPREYRFSVFFRF